MDLFSANQMMWAAFIIGNSAPIIFFILYYFGFISKMFQLFIIGILIGFLWEIPFGLAGDSFHLILINWPIDIPLARNITYSFIDSLIFLIGVFLARLVLKDFNFLYQFNYKALAVMVIWGSFSEFLIDLNGNGKLWLFIENWYNPVFISINNNDLTIIPQLIWLFAPILYYLAILKCAKKKF